MGGVFFAFSVFVMAALDRLPREAAAAAMQAINVAVITPLFMLAFLGTAVICVAVIAVSLPEAGTSSGALGIAGAVVYLVGVLVLTGGFHVPRNNALQRMGNGPEAAAYWPTYRRQWSRANHVRTSAGLLAALLLSICAALA
jgi:uncharacterized membrane protein